MLLSFIIINHMYQENTFELYAYLFLGWALTSSRFVKTMHVHISICSKAWVSEIGPLTTHSLTNFVSITILFMAYWPKLFIVIDFTRTIRWKMTTYYGNIKFHLTALKKGYLPTNDLDIYISIITCNNNRCGRSAAANFKF